MDEGVFSLLEAYKTLCSLGIEEDEDEEDEEREEDAEEEDADEDEDDVTPAHVRNAARLLASLLPPAKEFAEVLESPLLAAHCCHECFSPEQIHRVTELAEAHVAEHGWLTKRHSRHPTTDFSLHDAPQVWAAAEPTVTHVVLPTLHRLYFGGGGGNGEESSGVRLTINDLFYVRYDGDTAGAQRELEPHRDGSLLSFSIALTSPSSFTGGGTRFVGADQVMRPEQAGDLVTHSGKVLHAGEPVTAGVRDILVGFVTVTGPAVNEVFLASNIVIKAEEHPRLDTAIVNGALVATALGDL